MNDLSKTNICMIIGDPVHHSLSPRMHNHAYYALGIYGEFVFFRACIKSEQLKQSIEAARVLGIRGVTCTMPHKQAVVKYLDYLDPIAKRIGAVNSIVNQNGILKGYNTDHIGVVKPIEKLIKIKGRKIALLGAGGLAKAAAYAIKNYGGTVKIFNRTIQKARAIVKIFGGEAFGLNEYEYISDCDIIINTTSIGMGSLANASPIPKYRFNQSQIVFDGIYKPQETKLIQQAKLAGASVIYGYEMLLHQGIAQFELYTGLKAPQEVMKEALLL